MMERDDELTRVLEPLRADVEEHHRRLVGAGVAPEAIASALAGWGARGMLEHQGPAEAAGLLRTLAAEIEAGAELTPGASKTGAVDATPPGEVAPEQIMRDAVRGAAARLGERGVDPEMISAHALAVAAAVMVEAFGREGAAARLAAFSTEVVEEPKRPTGRA